MLLLRAVTHVRRITVSYPSVDSIVRYSNAVIACYIHDCSYTEKSLSFRDPKSNAGLRIGGTVSLPQPQLEFLLSRKQVAFMYVYTYKVE